MKQPYLITVPHAGTTTVRDMMQSRNMEPRWTHCEKIHEVAIPRILDENYVVTTLRDPCLVACSWVNRQAGGLESPRNQRRWIANWTRWALFVAGGAKLIDITTIDTVKNADHRGDPTGVKAAYLGQDWEKFYSLVPEELVTFAMEQISALRT